MARGTAWATTQAGLNEITSLLGALPPFPQLESMTKTPRAELSPSGLRPPKGDEEVIAGGRKKEKIKLISSRPGKTDSIHRID